MRTYAPIADDDLDTMVRNAQAGEPLGPAWTLRLISELRATKEQLEDPGDHEGLLLHLEEARSSGHNMRFQDYALPLGALLDIHERDHADMLRRPHPEGDHSHPDAGKP